MAHRTADRTERWDRDRYEFERERDRYGDVRERFEEDEDRGYVRRGPSSARGPPPRDDRSVGPSPSDTRFSDRRDRGRDDDEVVFRERRRVVYEDDEPSPRFARRRAPSSPPPPPAEYRRRAVSPPPELERSRVVIEKERYRSPSPEPPRRPTRLLRRQSSLDTFDRAPAKRYWERETAGREPYGPPARRGDVDPRDRVPPYNVDIPLPRSRALPPPRVYAEREYYDEIQVSDPHRYGDDDFHAPSFPPPPPERERVREKEVVRTRRRTRSRESRAVSRRSRSRSSSTSSSSSSSGGTTLTARSEYPKKGKTRVPARLVSKRALIDLGYPFVEEGNVIIVQKALGQQNIDDLLKLSDDYKKSELEIIAARSSAGDIIEERIEHRTEVYEGAAALPAPSPAPVIVQAPPAGGGHGHGHGHGGHGPVIIQAPSPATPVAAAPPVEVVKTTVVRDVSPARTYTTSSYDSTTSYTTSTTATPVIVEARPPPGVSAAVPVGPVALAEANTMTVARRRRDSLDSAADLRSEIRHLERQLARKEHGGHGHRRGHSRHRSASRGGELVRAERLSTGELVLFEEEVEQVQEPTRGSGVRIEKDKRGPPPKLMKAMLATLT